jgi:NAD(P)-dependent dehydrogenase (short-subunit alcohol dehydrogenase family)
VVGYAIERFGRIHAAVNNAGIEGCFGPVQDATSDDFDRIIGVNLKGVWLGMKYQIPHMLEKGGGAIVNTASSAGVTGIPMVALYTASKHGVVGLTKASALELATSGIRVNAVAPGPVNTGLLHRMIEGDCRGLFAFLGGHRRPLTGGAEHEQTLHAGLDVKIDQLPHHLLIDANFFIERRDDRQQYSTNHVFLLTEFDILNYPFSII